MNAPEITNESAASRWPLIQMLAGAAVILVLMTLALAVMGRRWWCACGTWSLSSWDIWSSHNSQHLMDPYFFSHLLHGILFFGFLQLLPGRVWMTARVFIAMTIEVGWELLENSPVIINRYREATISLDYFGDSIANSIVDVLACMLGYAITARIGWWSILLLISVELAMVFAIRDCLALNVLMLIWPIDAIKHWQSPG